MTRAKALTGVTYKVSTGCGSMYVTCNSEEGKLSEVFVRLGKSGGCAAAVNEGFGRLISCSLQAGVDPEITIKSLGGITCHAGGAGGGSRSCLDAISHAIKEHLEQTGGAVNGALHILKGTVSNARFYVF